MKYLTLILGVNAIAIAAIFMILRAPKPPIAMGLVEDQNKMQTRLKAVHDQAFTEGLAACRSRGPDSATHLSGVQK